jgi:cell wall-associated NlpC family hydrolase
VATPLPVTATVLLATFLFATFLFGLGSCTSFGSRSTIQIPVSPGQAQSALDAALTRSGCTYEWGGNGPDSFDCSGLIVWAYQVALGDNQIFSDGHSVVSDVTMYTLFKYNIAEIEAAEALPGDLVFITNAVDAVTHGGLVQAIQSDSVRFINASSFYDEVLVDEWPLTGTVRGQWIKGYGRLLASYK